MLSDTTGTGFYYLLILSKQNLSLNELFVPFSVYFDELLTVFAQRYRWPSEVLHVEFLIGLKKLIGDAGSDRNIVESDLVIIKREIVKKGNMLLRHTLDGGFLTLAGMFNHCGVF